MDRFIIKWLRHFIMFNHSFNVLTHNYQNVAVFRIRLIPGTIIGLETGLSEDFMVFLSPCKRNFGMLSKNVPHPLLSKTFPNHLSQAFSHSMLCIGKSGEFTKKQVDIHSKNIPCFELRLVLF